MLWSENEFFNFLETFLSITHEKYLLKNPQASHILEKDQRISFFTDVINRLHKNAKFIHLLRDGRDVLCSKLVARKRMGFGPASVKEGIEDWRRHILAARQASSFRVNRYLEVRYENLLESTPKELEMILSFCELEANSELIDTIVSNNTFEVMKKVRKTPDKDFVVNPKFFYKGKSGNWRVDLSPEDQYMFSRIAGELLIDLGYVNNNEWWYSSIGQKYKLILFSIFKEKLDEFKSLIKSIYLFLTRRS